MTKRKPTKPHKPGPGRPRITYDLKIIQALGEKNASLAQVAAYLDVDVSTVEEWNKTPAFRRARKRGKDLLRLKLKDKQIKAATTDGHQAQGTMLVWLGKNLLKQTDKTELAGKNGAPLFGVIERVIVKPKA